MKNHFVLFFCLITLSTQAQLETYNIHPIFSITSDFIGGNYSVSNVQYTGSSEAVGQFNFVGDSSCIGLTKGILLTTGSVVDTLGPIGPNDEISSTVSNNELGNILLDSLLNDSLSHTQEAAVLEFDFIPFVDSVSFKYVFGSEEYPEYVGSQFNDVFAIFLSGPGISGPENIAKLPNGEVVSINNVNQTMNSSYFVNNGDGTYEPYFSDPYYIQYDGFTTPLFASKTGLIIGQTYHLTIAIADVNDGIFDSGLFIESCEGCNFNVGMSMTEQDEFMIYPNPSNADVTILNLSGEVGKVSIYRSSGELVREIDMEMSEFTVSGLESGVFHVVFEGGNGSILFSKRLCIVK